MTTPAAERLYRAQHEHRMEGRRPAAYNPHSKPIESLPVIYGFNNGGSKGNFHAMALAQDGEVLGGHICSHEGFMEMDLGILEGARPDRHADSYSKHYPDGYRMEFVPWHSIDTHEGLQAAFAAARVEGAS